EGSGANAAWNGARLSEGHCAVDPRKVPYGSKVVFHDAECLAVDSGPDVVNRKAARRSGRNAAERSGTQRDRDRSFFRYEREGSCLGKSESRFHAGASSLTRHPDRVLKLVPETKLSENIKEPI